MENSQSYSELVQATFGDYQQEANVKQLAEQKTQEEKEQIQGFTSPFEAEGLREGMSGLISSAKDKIVDKVKGKAKQILEKAKKEASDKFDELKQQGDEFKSQATDKLDELEGKINELQEKGQLKTPKTPQEKTTEEQEAPEVSDEDADLIRQLDEISGGEEQPAPEQPSPGESPEAGQVKPDASDLYSAQEEAGDQLSTAPIKGDEDLQLQSFTNEGADVTDEAINVGSDVADVTADVAEGSAFLDIDPVTAGIGLAIGLGSLLVGNLFESHTEPPPQVKFNASQQLGVF
mgnify:CR=1 FL=1